MSHAEARRILGVDAAADKSAIQDAYRDLAKVWHPDRFASENERLRAKAEDRFKEIQSAYDLLSKSRTNGSRPDSTRHQETKEPVGKWARQQPRISQVRFWLILTGLLIVAMRFGLIFRSLLVSVVVIAIILWITLTFSRVRLKDVDPGA